jgi:phosphonate transport system substrate-binding protein
MIFGSVVLVSFLVILFVACSIAGVKNMCQRALRWITASLFFLISASTGFAAEPLTFGVYPYLSPTQVVEQYGPLREYLAKTLNRPVNMVSAPDFPSFIERTGKGEYDLVFTAPHMGRLAEKRDGWRRVAQTGYQMEIVVLARADSPIQRLDDLRGKSMAIGARNSMTYQVVNEALGKKKLALERDVRVLETPSFSNVLHALVRGEADTGATSKRLWMMAPAEQRNAAREIYDAPPSPGFFVMAHPRLGNTIEILQKALYQFRDTPEGAVFFEKTKQLDFRPIDEAVMQRIDPYTAVLQ